MKILDRQTVIDRALSSGENIIDAVRINKRWYVSVICKENHNYQASFSNFFYQNSRCPICKGSQISARCQAKQEELEEIIFKKHRIKLIQLKELYHGISTKAKFNCSIHGDFDSSFLIANQKYGCKKCSNEKSAIDRLKSFKEICAEITSKGYEIISKQEDYSGNKSTLILNCPNHGQFKTRWNDISSGHGCRKCGAVLVGKKSTTPDLVYINLAKKNEYKFISQVPNTKPKRIILNCPKHGDFEIIGSHFKNGSGCSKCNTKSFIEEEIFLYIKSIKEDAVSRDRTIGKELDIFVPSAKFALEYNGLYWHSEKFKKSKDHYNKYLKCKENDIKLFAIFSDEWENKQDLVKAMIRSRLGKSNATKIRPSSLEIKVLNKNKEFEDFFNRYHLDGHRKSKFAIGLFYQNKMVSCASFSYNSRHKCLEITRFATDYNYLINGNLSKIIKKIKNMGYDRLISYSNNRLSHGNVYEKLGFREITETLEPSYWYTDYAVRLFRTKCQRINDPEILTIYPTEKAQALGGIFSKKYLGHSKPLYKIYDYGHRKWELIIKQ